MAPSKLHRHLDLIAYLVGRRLPVAVEELMERIPGYAENWNRGDAQGQGAARRAFERDKDELRSFGIPLRTVPYTIDGEGVEGYEILRRDFYLPYLKLVAGASTGNREYAERHRPANVEINEQDAPLALEALRRVASLPSFPFVAEARSAFRKLAFDLDPGTFAGKAPVLFADRPDAKELSQQLRIVSDALLARKRLRFRYHGIYRGEETERDVAACGLLYQNGHWYLVGHDATRDSMRIFRVGRMEDVKPNTASPNTPDYVIPDDFELQSYAGRQSWELGEQDEAPLTAQVLFRFPQSLWAERNHYGTMTEARGDGSTVREFEVHQVNPFLRWVLSLEGDALIVSPVELREQLRSLARGIATAHRGADHVGE